MNRIGQVIKLLLYALPAFCFLLFALNLLRQRQSVGMAERFGKCMRAFPAVLIVSLLGGCLCVAYETAQEPYTVSFKMGYTYPKASKGLTPNSTTLDVNEIIGDEVLQKAIDSGLLGNLTPEEIRDTLSIDNIKQRGSVSVDDLYVSTEYIISYQASDKTAFVNKDILVKTIADAYYDYFVTRYGRRTDVLEKDYSDLSGLDYLDSNTYLARQVNSVIEYMDMCSRENATFVSGVTGESFGSIKDKAVNFRDVSLERNKAYILKYGLSRDRDRYISRLNQENRTKNIEYMKDLAAYRVRLSAIDRYAGEITRSVLVPTRDDDGEFYQSRTKIGTDYFAEEANGYLKVATNSQLNIETNNYYIESLSAAAGGRAHQKKADEMVESLKSEILSISRQAAETVKDYDARTSNGYISFVLQEEKGYLGIGIRGMAVYMAALLAAVYTGSGSEPGKRKKERQYRTEG